MKKYLLVFLLIFSVSLCGCSDLSYLHDQEEFVSESILLYTIERPIMQINGIQGGYADENYYYQAFIMKDIESDEEKNIVRIVVSDFETGEFIKSSDNLSLNHANDITMNTKTGELIVCHNNPNRTKISIIDPDSLTVKETKEVPRKIFSIDYNEKRDCYVVGLSGGQTFAIWDSNFNEIAGPFEPTGLTEGYVTQGVSCNDDFVFFVLYKDNVITVYDWDGNFITLIKLNDISSVLEEPENISIVNDEIFVGCAASEGMKVYKVEPIKG